MKKLIAALSVLVAALSVVSSAAFAQSIRVAGNAGGKTFTIVRIDERVHPKFDRDRWDVLVTQDGQEIVLTCGFKDLNVVPAGHDNLARAILARTEDYRFLSQDACYVLSEIARDNRAKISASAPITIEVNTQLLTVGDITVDASLRRGVGKIQGRQ